jgi:GTPase
MQPVIALVGRPNVGKSTLFNLLTRTRDALVGEWPGLTRDRQYGIGRAGDGGYVVVDTGGLGDDPDGVEVGMRAQTLVAVDEADLIVFMVDARAGITAADETIAETLRRSGKPVVLAVNKVDGVNPALATADAHRLGLGEPQPIAATRNQGVNQLIAACFERLAAAGWGEPAAAVTTAGPDAGLAPDRAPPAAPDLPAPSAAGGESIRVAIVGRPNVGKSTLLNRLFGDERVLVYDLPGTTRDSVHVPFERDGQAYVLIDTAGVRRRSRISETVEKFSIIKTLKAIDQANVVLMVLDARTGVSDQDAHLVGHILEAGRGLVLVVNKWDGLDRDAKSALRRLLELKLGFIEHAAVHYVSAREGSGVGLLLPAVRRVHAASQIDLSTARLTATLEQAVSRHPPPYVQGRRIKLRYAHQGGRNPPVIVIHGNQTDAVPKPYIRYLENAFRKALDLQGTPIRLVFRSGENPYAGRKNLLTPRQRAQRQRLMRFVKK